MVAGLYVRGGDGDLTNGLGVGEGAVGVGTSGRTRRWTAPLRSRTPRASVEEPCPQCTTRECSTCASPLENALRPSERSVGHATPPAVLEAYGIALHGNDVSARLAILNAAFVKARPGRR